MAPKLPPPTSESAQVMLAPLPVHFCRNEYSLSGLRPKGQAMKVQLYVSPVSFVSPSPLRSSVTLQVWPTVLQFGAGGKSAQGMTVEPAAVPERAVALALTCWSAREARF